jgi:CubicO group peptidase (beta-lactamase class C family)
MLGTASLADYLAAPNRAEWLMRVENGSTIRLEDNFPYNDWNYILGPAGGINSNIKDMTHWLMLQANRGQFKGQQLISINNMKQMTRPMIYAGEMPVDVMQANALYYALGWVHMQYSPYPIIWHDGSTLGVYNVAAFIPEEKLGIVILTNVRNTKLAFVLMMQFFDLYFNKKDQNWSQKLLEATKLAIKTEMIPQKLSPALPLLLYTGSYHNPIFGNVLVKEENNQLTLTMGKNKQRFVLQHWDRDIFTSQWPLVEDEKFKILFSSDEKGQIDKMQIDLFTKEGDGNFVKITE